MGIGAGALACASGGLREFGLVEPWSRRSNAAQFSEGTGEGGGLRGARRIQAGAAGHNREWQTSDRRDDARHLPSPQDAVSQSRLQPLMAATEGQFIGEALFVVEPPVIVVGSVVAAPVDKKRQAAVVATDIAKPFAPCERAVEGEPPRSALIKIDLQRLIVGREA